MTGGAGYAQRHIGQWHGHGAKLVGLRGEVIRDQFETIREDLHPETEEFLPPRHSADRIATDGSEQSKSRSLYDLTFSTPNWSVAMRG
jgi:hypothetical protein